MTAQIRLSLAAPAAEIVIDAPARRNAFNTQMWAALPGLIAEAEAMQDAKVVILHGGGTGHFAAGADISEFETIYADKASAGRSADTIARALDAIEACTKPVIAAIEGACVGGGVSIALACDIRIASEKARFGVTPARLGLVYPAGDTRRLVSAVGVSQAKDILFTGTIFGADRARRIGLVTETCEAGSALGAAREKAMLIASVSQASVRGSKQLVNRLESQAGLSDEDGRRLFVEAVCGPDFHEGYRAFLEKRSPDFPTE